jgi:hypothetical protein
MFYIGFYFKGPLVHLMMRALFGTGRSFSREFGHVAQWRDGNRKIYVPFSTKRR